MAEAAVHDRDDARGGRVYRVEDPKAYLRTLGPERLDGLRAGARTREPVKYRY